MASTELKRTISSAGSQTKWGASAWVKRSDLGLSAGVYCSSKSDTTANNRGIFFNADDKIECAFYDGGYTYQVVTNRKFRDTNAWYHIVVNLDTSQSTSTDRIKIWVNGVQETSMATSSYPSQGSTHNFLGTDITQLVGSLREGSSIHHSCIISHLHFTDGYCYPASTFGETDATTGEWKIKTSPTVANYGTNGFFILKNGNSVTDQSGQGNNLTVSAGTLTKTEDNPSNVFATMNPLNVPTSNAPSFSYGNTKTQTAGTSGRFGGTSTLGMAKGKFYIEAKAIVDATYSRNCIGICYNPVDQARNNDTHYSYSDGWSYNSETGAVVTLGTTFYTASTYTTGDIIQMAIDCDNWKLYYGKNGTWLNSGDPTSGSTGTGSASLTADKTYFVIQSDNTGTSSPSTFEFNFGNGYFGSTQISSAGTNASGNGIFEYDVPTGYTALSTKGLNE